MSLEEIEKERAGRFILWFARGFVIIVCLLFAGSLIYASFNEQKSPCYVIIGFVFAEIIFLKLLYNSFKITNW